MCRSQGKNCERAVRMTSNAYEMSASLPLRLHVRPYVDLKGVMRGRASTMQFPCECDRRVENVRVRTVFAVRNVAPMWHLAYC